MSRDELIDELNTRFGSLLASIDGLDDTQMTAAWYGKWSVNHLLAHVSGWHREMIPALERIARGERPIPEDADYSNLDAWNTKFAEGAEEEPPASIIAEARASKEAFEARGQENSR